MLGESGGLSEFLLGFGVIEMESSSRSSWSIVEEAMAKTVGVGAQARLYPTIARRWGSK